MKDPQTLEEISIPEDLKLTLEKKPFLLKESMVETKKIMIFSTKSNIRKLAASLYWLWDGTFSVVPHLFYQLWTIHGYVGLNFNRKCVPLLYVLMSGKSKELYSRVFEELMAIIQEEDNDLMTKYVICDFETAPISAAKEFMDIEMFGCVFHFSQSLIRNFSNELRKAYCNDGKVNLLMKELFSLAYVDPNLIQSSYDLLKPQLKELPGIDKFLDYFEKTWIGFSEVNAVGIMIKRQPKFNPKVWSAHKRILDGYPTTSNSIEAWNGRFKRLVGRSHVGLFEIIRHMREEQRIVEGTAFYLESARDRKNRQSDDDRIYQILDDPPKDLQVFMSSCATNL